MRGSDPNTQNNQGLSILAIAIKEGNSDLA